MLRVDLAFIKALNVNFRPSFSLLLFYSKASTSMHALKMYLIQSKQKLYFFKKDEQVFLHKSQL